MKKQPATALARQILACLALLTLLLGACGELPASHATKETALDPLLRLIGERLALAPAVARNKWNSGAAIDDLPREKRILAHVAGEATAYGLSPAESERFFAAQIEASKLIQRRLHAEWRAGGQGPFAEVADLGKDIRPQLDRLTPRLLAALAAARPLLAGPDGPNQLAAARTRVFGPAGSSDGALASALAPLQP